MRDERYHEEHPRAVDDMLVEFLRFPDRQAGWPYSIQINAAPGYFPSRSTHFNLPFLNARILMPSPDPTSGPALPTPVA